MRTEKEKMLAGELYRLGDAEIQADNWNKQSGLVPSASLDLSQNNKDQGGSHAISPWISILLVVSAGLAAQTAAAGPQEDVAAAGQKWGTVFADNNPDTIMPLYAKDGVLWGTLSPTVRSDPAAVKAYFVAAFQALPKATVKFGDQLIRVYGDTAVNTGYYTFSFTKDGETKSIPARYSFTYVKDGNDWKIVDHHSSAVPAPCGRADAPAQPAPHLRHSRTCGRHAPAAVKGAPIVRRDRFAPHCLGHRRPARSTARGPLGARLPHDEELIEGIRPKNLAVLIADVDAGIAVAHEVGGLEHRSRCGDPNELRMIAVRVLTVDGKYHWRTPPGPPTMRLRG